MNTLETNNRPSYIQAVKMTDEIFFPNKSQKDYHSIHWDDLINEFREKIKKLNYGISEEIIDWEAENFISYYINDIGYNEELINTPLKPQSIDVQLFLSHVKFFIPGLLTGKDYNMLQQKGGENAFENLGDLEEVRDYITKENIHNYAKEVLSSAIETKYLGNIADPAIAQDILLHFGLSPITNRVHPGYVSDVVKIIENRVRVLEKTYMPMRFTAEEMGDKFSLVIDEITEYVWSTCKLYLDSLIGKAHSFSMSESGGKR